MLTNTLRALISMTHILFIGHKLFELLKVQIQL